MRVLGFLALAFAAMLPAKADVIFNLNQPYSGTAPVGSLQAAFANVTDGVQLTLTAFGFGDTSQKITEWDFNIDTAFDAGGLGSLVFTHLSGVAARTTVASVDGYRAGGNGEYDLSFLFPESGTTLGAVNPTSVYRLSGISGLTENSFRFLSDNSHTGETRYYTAAHVQSIGQDRLGGWIGTDGAGGGQVPEPATWVLIGAGAVLIALGKLYRPHPRP